MPTPNFTVEGRLATISDVQRNFMFEVIISDIGKMTGNAINTEGLTIRAKTASIPSRGNESIDSFFMGMKQIFPGRPTFTNTLSVTLDETEDQIVTKALYAWRNRIFDTNPQSKTAGYSQAINKRALSASITLRQYKYNGVKLDNDIVFYNAWPSEVGDVELNMTGSEKVVYSVTFTYDYWKLVKA